MQRLIPLLIILVLGLPFAAKAIEGTANEIEFQNGTIGIIDPIIVAKGGTGLATLTDFSVLIGKGTAAIEFATGATAGRALLDQGAAANPAFGALDLALAAATTGVLPPEQLRIYRSVRWSGTASICRWGQTRSSARACFCSPRATAGSNVSSFIPQNRRRRSCPLRGPR